MNLSIDPHERVYNFAAGPAVLPETVLRQISEEMVSLPGVGSSILELSHRGPVFTDYMNRARNGLRSLLAIGDDHEVMFLQGGSRLQFAMIPMNFLDPQRPAAYAVTGSWGKQAFQESQKIGPSELAWDGAGTGFTTCPDADLDISPEKNSYLYFVSNETIQGVQFDGPPESNGCPLICDASSDILHRPVDIDKYSMLYACAQKNAGPAGLTIVIGKKKYLETGNDSLPGYLDFRSHAKEGSLFNTPPTFAIYVLALVVEWLQEEIGGLGPMYELNKKKAQLLYDVIDQYPDVYLSHASKECRSIMNVVFKFENDQLQKKFLEMAEKRKMFGLNGHRSVGGIRASIYNAMPLDGVQALAELMNDFVKQQAN